MRKYSEACEQNKGPILDILVDVYKDCQNVLEIGSGTGQHAVYFAANLPHLIWQPSELAENLSSIQAWIEFDKVKNIKAPIELDVCKRPWPITQTQAIFSANCFHIMSWELVEHFFKGTGEVLSNDGILYVYGPFSYRGKHTSQSNEEFDDYLRRRDPLSGVRDFVDVDGLAKLQSLDLIQDFAMPVNNRSLVWQKR